MPLLGIGTGDWRTKSEVVSPRDIAQGRGDAMNNYHRPFSAFEANGRTRGPAHTTAAFLKAWDLGAKPASRAAYQRLITPLGR
jgi:hypothetical protein